MDCMNHVIYTPVVLVLRKDGIYMLEHCKLLLIIKLITVFVLMSLI